MKAPCSRSLSTAALVVLLSTGAAGAAGSEWQSLLNASPFAGPSPASAGTTLEFRGVVRDGDVYLLSLYDRMSHRSAWLPLGGQFAGYVIAEYDVARLTVRITRNGQELALALMPAKVMADVTAPDARLAGDLSTPAARVASLQRAAQEGNACFVGLYDPGTRQSRWVPIGRPLASHEILDYDPARSTVRMSRNELELPLARTDLALGTPTLDANAGANPSSPEDGAFEAQRTTIREQILYLRGVSVHSPEEVSTLASPETAIIQRYQYLKADAEAVEAVKHIAQRGVRPPK